MHHLKTLTSLVPLLPVALSAPHRRQEAYEFNITSLAGRFPTTGPYGTGPIDSALSITLTYPDSSSTSGATLSTSCSYDWPASTPPGPTEWTECEDPALQWRLPVDGWTSFKDYRVEVFQTLTSEGAGLYATHGLTFRPGMSSDPDAFLSCLQMGKFTPEICQINGPLSAQPGPVVMEASRSTRPN